MSVQQIQTAVLEEGRSGDPHVPDLGRALEVFLAERPRLLRLALKVVGDAATAEDVVQDAWLRWQRTDRAGIRNPAAFLTTTTTHLAINVIQSARRRRELPADESRGVLDGTADAHAAAGSGSDPTVGVERAVVVEETLLLMMARLSSAELAAYVLRKGFDYPYGDIATLLGTSIPNTRQLVRRSRIRLENGSARTVDPAVHRALVSAFLRAADTGQVTDLEELLTARAPRRLAAPAWSRSA